MDDVDQHGIPETAPLSGHDPVFQDEPSEFPESMDCFTSDGFDPGKFEEFAREFLRNLPEFMEAKDFEKIQKEKAKMVSELARNLYIMCTLSREQIKNVTSFWKSMICFISPENASSVKKIHVSYTSCMREAQRRSAVIDAKHLELFTNCVYFSLAIDTAQFYQDHFLSCVGRFGFDDRIVQEILIFDKISQTTGQDSARFVFGKLNEKCCDFSKLVSITTDGASNMTSKACGLASEMVRLINGKLNTNKGIGVDAHCLWCIDHRLNLVAQDFTKVPNINFVMTFIRWITASDRLVSYTLFVWGENNNA